MALSSSLSRCWAVFVKEVIQFRRDKMTFLILLSVPVLELLLFGYAISFDARHLPTAVVDFSRDRFSRSLLAGMENADYYDLRYPDASLAAAETLMRSGDVQFIVIIPPDVGEKLLRGEQPKVLVEADMTDPVATSSAVSALAEIGKRAGVAAGLAPEAGAPRPGLDIVVHKRFNPESLSQYNIIPGLLGVILEMSMMITMGLALTRESERGTMENLLSLPFSATEVLIGKTIPYIAVGLVQAISVIIVAQGIFAVPVNGSLGLLWAACVAFIVCMVLLGYTFSTFVRTQMQATQVTMFYFLPSLLLSGFMFPFGGMPGWAQALGECLPLTHFMRIARAVMLKGADLTEVSRELVTLLGFILLFAAVALVRFRRTLD